MKVEQNPIAQSLLEQIRQHQQQISETRIEAGFEVDSDNNQVNFSELVGSALDEVNALKKSSAASAAAYESGVDIPLSDVMVNMQKSSLESGPSTRTSRERAGSSGVPVPARSEAR